MDKFHIKVTKYIEDRINFKKLTDLDCSITVTKQVPVMMHMEPSNMLFNTYKSYTEVLVSFGIGAEEIFDNAMLKCEDCFAVAEYGKVKSAKRFAFNVMSFSYCVNGIWYSMVQRNIMAQLAAPLVETSGSGITMLVTGKSFRTRTLR